MGRKCNRTKVGTLMKIIGITGRSGSGKGYVCARFAEHGIPMIDTDAVVHALYRENESCINELEAAFGPLRSESGEVDRKKLGSIVFSDSEKLNKLNMIVHRYVAEEIERICTRLEADGHGAVLVDAPQLFEAHLEHICDLVIAVTAPEEIRIDRICKRDGISVEGASTRLNHQLEDDFFISHADVVIVNDGRSDVGDQVKKLLDRIL